MNQEISTYNFTKNKSVGLEEHPKPESTYKAMIYPNPASDYTTISYNCGYLNLSYSITDMSGKTVLSGVLPTIEGMEHNEVLVGLPNLKQGSYNFKISSGKDIIYSSEIVINK